MQISEATLQFIAEHARADVRTLALQGQKYPEVDMPTAITQIAGRQVAEAKIPSWHNIEGIYYPKHLSMEQCSSEATAHYKAGLVEGDTFVDLTGGFGIDCSFIARRFKQADYVERQTELCELAEHNFPLLGLSIQVHNKDGVDYLKEMKPVDCIYLDPARRDGHGGKTVAISDCEPDVSVLEDLLLEKAKTVLVKLSPMLDLSLALKTLKYIHQIHIVSGQAHGRRGRAQSLAPPAARSCPARRDRAQEHHPHGPHRSGQDRDRPPSGQTYRRSLH